MFSWERGQEKESGRELRDYPRQLDRHLFNPSNVSDEHIIVDELEDVPQLLEVSQEIFTNPLQEHKLQLRQPIRADFPVVLRQSQRVPVATTTGRHGDADVTLPPQ